MCKRLTAFLLFACLVFSLFSCGGEDFSHCEITLALTEDFKSIETEDFDAAYSDGNLSVAIIRISFVAAVNDGISDTLSSSQFASFWLEKCGRDCEVTLYGGVDTAQYTDLVSDEAYTTVSAFYRSKYAYFVVLYTVRSSAFDSYRDSIYEYISGAYFTDPV